MTKFRKTPRTTSRRASRLRRTVATASALALVLSLGAPTAAQTVAGKSHATSSAYGERISLTVTVAPGLTLPVQSGPRPAVGGAAPPSYWFEDTELSLDVPLPVGLGGVRADTLDARAHSGLPLGEVAEAAAAIEDLAVAVSTLLILKASALSVEASVQPSEDEGCALGVEVDGDTSILGGYLAGTLVPGVIAIPSSPDPNTVLLDVDGVRVVLNEQFRDGSSIQVNALHVTLDVGVGTSHVAGDIVISHAQAAIDCEVPPRSDEV